MILCENKRIVAKKRKRKFEANKRNACETDLCSLRFALKRNKYISETGAPCVGGGRPPFHPHVLGGHGWVDPVTCSRERCHDLLRLGVRRLSCKKNGK